METSEIPYENSVVLCGRVAKEAVERELPSGDTLMTVRVIVRRSRRARRKSRVSVDAFECVAWTRKLQRSLTSLAPDDVVEVRGELRRRFRRVDGVPMSRFEVELTSCTRVARAS